MKCTADAAMAAKAAALRALGKPPGPMAEVRSPHHAASGVQLGRKEVYQAKVPDPDVQHHTCPRRIWRPQIGSSLLRLIRGSCQVMELPGT